ncbi:hemolymph protein isoform X1 [Bombyx mori]|uniref:30K protein 8 n=1 Tax=Bombyx mori TaxID=7091 RepID=H9J4M4_BOMMO|nr:hemolymph protein precursor [Bombyx mori]AFC87806.1 30K protein 8 [Bombyx mori]
MKFLVFFSTCVLGASAGLIDLDINILSAPTRAETRLVDAITTADYNTAVSLILLLEKQSSGSIIEDTVNNLIRDGNRNVLEFAYKLWIGEGKEIVKHYFPVQFRQVLSESNVKIINKRDNLAIKLGAATDSDNDRIAYGDANDKSSENVSWKLIPLWENNRVYFKIYSVRRHQYLKLGTATDGENDHSVYGDDRADTHRHQWYLKPAKLDSQVLFYIYNRQYNQALKLSRSVDSDGDRRAYSSSSSVEGQPELFGWSISIVN